MYSTTKMNIFTDTVLRREGGKLYLMNRQEDGFESWSRPVESEAWVLAHYNVQIGEWGSDSYGECCPVTRVLPEEFTPHDFGFRGDSKPLSAQESEQLHGLMGGHIRGGSWAPSMEHSVLAPFIGEKMTEQEAYNRFCKEYPALGATLGLGTRLLPPEQGPHQEVGFTDGYKDSHDKPFPSEYLGKRGSVAFGVGGLMTFKDQDPDKFAMKVRLDSGPFAEGTTVPIVESWAMLTEESRAQALGRILYEDEELEEHCFSAGTLTDGMSEFISSHPGVRLALGCPYFIALMPDGTVYAVDKDGTVVNEEELDS